MFGIAPACGGDDDAGPSGGPRLTVDWQTVWFDPVRGRSESEPVGVTVFNAGGGAAAGLAAAVVGDTDAFRIVNDQCGGRGLWPGATCTVWVALGSKEAGPFQGALRVWSTAAPGGPATSLELELRGRVASAELVATSAAPVVDVAPGATANVSITVENAGGAVSGPIVVSDAAPCSLAGDCVGRRLAGGERCSLTATCPTTPGIAGLVSARVLVDADPGGQASLDVGANAVAAVALEVADLDFGSVPTGYPVAKRLTVRNPAAVTATVLGAALTEDVTQHGFLSFSITDDDCTGKRLEPAQTCELEISMQSAYVISSVEASLAVSAEGFPIRVTRVRGSRYRNHFNLDVAFAGTGSGAVFFKGSADPSTGPFGFVGVNGSAVTLQATPDSGSAFAGWSGACSGTGDCIVAPADNADVAVTATFTAL